MLGLQEKDFRKGQASLLAVAVFTAFAVSTTGGAYLYSQSSQDSAEKGVKQTQEKISGAGLPDLSIESCYRENSYVKITARNNADEAVNASEIKKARLDGNPLEVKVNSDIVEPGELLEINLTTGLHGGRYTVDIGSEGKGPSYNCRLPDIPNEEPEAEFDYSPERPEIGESISFDASASSDLDGTIKTYRWDWTNDGSFDTSGETASHSYSAGGDKEVKLEVIDVKGGKDNITKTVELDREPTADFFHEPEPAELDEQITFDASPSTDDGSIVRYEWDMQSNGYYNQYGETTTHTYVNQFFDVTLRVTDDTGKTDTVTKSITTDTDPEANFTYSPNPAELDEQITFNASSSTDEGEITSYEWDLQSNGYYRFLGGKVITATYSNQFHDVTLRVTDDSGNTDTFTRELP